MRWAYWWLICNHLGQVMGVLSQRIPFQGSVAMVEALAAKRAIEFALKIGIWKTEIEGDTVVVMKILNDSDVNLSPVEFILQEAKLMAKNMDCYSVAHVGRNGNKVAHA